MYNHIEGRTVSHHACRGHPIDRVNPMLHTLYIDVDAAYMVYYMLDNHAHAMAGHVVHPTARTNDLRG